MSQLINKHVQYSGWQTAMKVAEMYRIKTFYSNKTTQWLHICQKTFPWSQSPVTILFVSARNTSRCKVIYKWINITDREGREVDTFCSFFFGLFDKQECWDAALTGLVIQQVTFTLKKRHCGKNMQLIIKKPWAKWHQHSPLHKKNKLFWSFFFVFF